MSLTGRRSCGYRATNLLISIDCPTGNRRSTCNPRTSPSAVASVSAPNRNHRVVKPAPQHAAERRCLLQIGEIARADEKADADGPVPDGEIDGDHDLTIRRRRPS